MPFDQISLSNLTPPDVVETLDYEEILSQMLANLQALDESFSALVESDPAYKILEVAAYRESILRQRINDAARGCMLATATGADLDQLAANFNVARAVVQEANLEAYPPEEAVYESDAALRERAQLAFEGLSTAGPGDAYRYHALSAHSHVLDARAYSPEPGQVTLTVLSMDGDGTPDQEQLDAVDAACNSDDTRPLTDQLTVAAAEIVNYGVVAAIRVYPGQDVEAVCAAAAVAGQAYCDEHHRLAHDITISGLHAALHSPGGVQGVNLLSPVADVVCSDSQAPYCTTLTVTSEGYDE